MFLGEVPDARLDEVIDVLGQVRPPGEFSLRLVGGGRFGTAAWAGVSGEMTALSALRTNVGDALTAAGFPSDGRPFQPHLTVSYRGDGPTRLALAGYSGGEWPVREFALVLSRDGGYQQLRSWPTAA